MTWRGAGSFLGARSPELRVGARSLAWTPTDPLAAREWNLAAVNAFAYADMLPVLQDDPITVAIIDSGIDRTSPDLDGAVPLAPIDEARDPTTSLVHGTAVAGIIAADANNGIGGVGIGAPYVRLLDYRVVGGGDVDPEVEARAIRNAVGAGARVINLSLGGHRDPKNPALDEFSRAERDADLVCRQRGGSWSSRRSGTRRPGTGVYASWPAALATSSASPRWISGWPGRRSRTPTRSTTTSQRPARASSRRCRARSRRPAHRSTPRPGRASAPHGTVLGTSFAAPHVSAAAAVLLARHPELTPSQVRWILERTARRLGDASGVGRDRAHGLRAARRHGRRQARRRARRPACRRPMRASRTTSPPSAQTLPTSVGFTDAIADFGDDRRDVYKVFVRRGRDAADPHRGPAAGRQPRARHRHLRARLARPRELAVRPLRSRRAANAKSLLRVRNTSPRDGYYLVQATVRRGWGAYRLRWNVTPSQQ